MSLWDIVSIGSLRGENNYVLTNIEKWNYSILRILRFVNERERGNKADRSRIGNVSVYEYMYGLHAAHVSIASFCFVTRCSLVDIKTKYTALWMPHFILIRHKVRTWWFWCIVRLRNLGCTSSAKGVAAECNVSRKGTRVFHVYVSWTVK